MLSLDPSSYRPRDCCIVCTAQLYTFHAPTMHTMVLYWRTRKVTRFTIEIAHFR